ncbi:MAG: DUF2461 domain-containing protein [Planctomycetota bacterium]
MFTGFPEDIQEFFATIQNNNRRDWFLENKSWYEDSVQNPALELVRSIEKPLKKVSPHFTAVAKKSGGSIMRIYRDTRFSKNKSPYKTNLGIHFKHEMGKDVHAPGFYFHVSAHSIFIGAGIWHPESKTLNQIRALIDDDAARFKRSRNSKKFKSKFEIGGDSLKRPPRGYEKDHPMIEDLKRKDHIAIASLDEKQIYRADLIDVLIEHFKAAKPFVRFLCDSIYLPC